MSQNDLEKNAQLKIAYSNWLDELRNKEPNLLSDAFSNPYYACIPKGWSDSEVRILIVGEEGFGLWGRGREDGVMPDDIESIQTFCWSSLASYLNQELEYELYPLAYHFQYRHSPFWSRARKLFERGVCAWTNIDLIHYRSDENGKCVLSDIDRARLHSLDSRILAETIDIMQPTHVVFSGWYGISLKHELPEVFQELYPNDLGDDSRWKKNVVTVPYKGIYYIFSYHPNWGIRQKNYEKRVLSELDCTIGQRIDRLDLGESNEL